MPDVSDIELLQDYERRDSEEAFAELVRRHINLVYSAALRHVQVGAQAEEITQAVFVILARKAGSLWPNTILEGWLYETTRLTSLRFLRGERRRQFREQEAHMRSTLQEDAEDSVWNQLSPMLDEALSHLGRKDRDAVMLRFFKDKSVKEVAAALDVSEAAAQRRVLRAMEKLRKFFAKRGVGSTTEIIAGAISAHSVQAAPVALANTITLVAAKGSTASASTLTLIKGALKVMAWTKAKTAIVIGLGVLLAASTATITVKEIQVHKRYPWQVPKADFGIFYNMPARVAIVPTRFAQNGGSCSDGGRGAMGIAQSLETIVQVAYRKDNLRTVVKTDLPKEKYDFIAKLVGARQPHKNLPIDENWTIELQKEIKRKFGITGSLQMIETDVLTLKPCAAGIRGFKESHSMPNGIAVSENKGIYSYYQQPASTVVGLLERNFKLPVVDQTGLSRSYDYIIKYDEPDPQQPNLEGLKQALLAQLGLELVPTNMPIEMLVVEKAK